MNHLNIYKSNSNVSKIFDKLNKKLPEGIISELGNKLSPSELNTFLLELHKQVTASKSPFKLLEEFSTNRFVTPSDIDPIRLKMLEVEWLDIALNHHFAPIELSPLTPVGSSSIIAPISQNNVVSACRNTELVSDSTNVLALKISQDFRNSPGIDIIRYCATHRHVRGQAFDNPLWSSHFSILCMASGGLDTGNYQTETKLFLEHVTAIYKMLSGYFPNNHLTLKLFFKNGNQRFKNIILKSYKELYSDRNYSIQKDNSNSYYGDLQFKIFTKKNGEEINLADGGLVDWTQQILSNKKQRLFISGIGTDLILKLRDPKNSNSD